MEIVKGKSPILAKYRKLGVDEFHLSRADRAAEALQFRLEASDCVLLITADDDGGLIIRDNSDSDRSRTVVERAQSGGQLMDVG